MKVGPKSSLRPFSHQAPQIQNPCSKNLKLQFLKTERVQFFLENTFRTSSK